MRGKIGLGVLVLGLWSSPARAEGGASFVQARDGGSATAVTVADGERRTALVGFQALGHEARVEISTLPNRAADDDDSDDDWHLVCVAPCTGRVPLDATYRFRGSDYDASEPFRLPPDRERIMVTSQLESQEALRTGAVVMTVVGWTSFGLIGPLLFVKGALDGKDAMAISGVALALGGAIVGTVGAVILAVSHDKHSTVSIARNAAPKLALPGGIGLDARGFTF